MAYVSEKGGIAVEGLGEWGQDDRSLLRTATYALCLIGIWKVLKPFVFKR